MDFKKEGSQFTNNQGKLDIKKLLTASPKILSKFINKRKADDTDGEGGSSNGYGNSATATLNTLAAIAQADQRPHYAPANSKDVVNALAITAQNSLDLSAGLGMTPGRSSFPDHQFPGGVNPDYAKKGADDKGASNNKSDKDDKK